MAPSPTASCPTSHYHRPPCSSHERVTGAPQGAFLRMCPPALSSPAAATPPGAESKRGRFRKGLLDPGVKLVSVCRSSQSTAVTSQARQWKPFCTVGRLFSHVLTSTLCLTSTREESSHNCAPEDQWIAGKLPSVGLALEDTKGILRHRVLRELPHWQQITTGGQSKAPQIKRPPGNPRFLHNALEFAMP